MNRRISKLISRAAGGRGNKRSLKRMWMHTPRHIKPQVKSWLKELCR